MRAGMREARQHPNDWNGRPLVCVAVWRIPFIFELISNAFSGQFHLSKRNAILFYGHRLSFLIGDLCDNY